ncbi:hypothetical protein Nepgr_003043 [Nepenthes gracilis]|uniref:AAA+ ATPase domain-containing protein n=1 Tax=Nepenthes gracilis TaxID=150966 RepID=A0AAD3RYW5_NEPGR|nr:hypothetical protein Nepgr_003043 [Nepenthes gracilis]
MDGRRHSVDLPISKTLVALRRVRSLRDPSTNSMSKFSALIDGLNWDTNSCNGISLAFENGGEEDNKGKDALLGSKVLSTCGEEETVRDVELCDSSVKLNSKLTSRKNSSYIRNSDTINEGMKSKQEINGNRVQSESHIGELKDNELELACISHSKHHLEGGDSNHEPDIRSPSSRRKIHISSKRKTHYRNYKMSLASVGNVISRVDSPFPCPSDSLQEGSTHSTSLFSNEEADIVDRHHHGCTVSCCWSRTPNFRRSNGVSDEEECPLISEEIDDFNMPVQSRSWKRINSEIVPYSGSPRSLSQKYSPKSFSELVGQSVVVQSLLTAISKGRIASLYVFHGPHGTGKSCASRIFAAALNCLSLKEYRPCGLCQECVLYFTGRSRDVKKVDSVRLNHANRLRSLVKDATVPPISSRFKVFVVDDCHLLKEETWTTLLHSFDSLCHHVVFVIITPNLDKLPRSVVARAQKYYFPKIRDVDIAYKLEKICVEEGLEFEDVALDFIAAKSNGSLRDAELMLDQLSLLGKKITIALAYELVGAVSDDELLDLLDLAISSDTSNTVRRARELMRSRIDPMQLISQLANIIMDILAGNCQEERSEIRRNFLRRHACELDLQKLRHALKILSDSEKQLRTSKNQTTWLTVALLQLNPVDSSVADANEPRLSTRPANHRERDCCSTFSQGERLKHLEAYDCSDDELGPMGLEDYGRTLESIWMRAAETCQSISLKKFMRKRGKLSSIFVKKGLAVVELEFCHPNYVSKAEKSWKLIASSLQSVLGCNVEIRMTLSPRPSLTGCPKVKRPSFSFFSCSNGMDQKSQSATEGRSYRSDTSNFTSDKAVMGDRPIDASSSGGESQFSRICSHRKEIVSIIRNNDGNALSTGTTSPCRLSQDGIFTNPRLATISSTEEGSILNCQVLTVPEPVIQPSCFPKTMRIHKKLLSLYSSNSKLQPQDRLVVPDGREASFNTYISNGNSYVLCDGNSNSRHPEGSMDHSKLHCWRAPQFSLKKPLDGKHGRRRSHLMEWVLPCAAAD